MASTSDMSIKVTANTTGVNAGLDRAEKRIRGFSGKVNNMSSVVSRASSGINSALAAIGVGFSAGAIVNAINTTVDRIDALGDRASGLNETAANLAEVEYVAERLGSSGEAAAKGMDRLTRSIGEAATKGGESAKAFEAIGLNVQDLSEMSPAEAFAAVAGAISQVVSPYERMAIAQEIFGKGAADLMPLLASAAEGWGAIADEGMRLGAIPTEEMVERIGEVDNATIRMQGAFQGAQNKIVSEIAPSLVGAIDSVANAIASATSNMDSIRLTTDFAFDSFSHLVTILDKAHGLLKMIAGVSLTGLDFLGITSSQTGTGAVNQEKLNAAIAGGNKDLARRRYEASQGSVGMGRNLMAEGVSQIVGSDKKSVPAIIPSPSIADGSATTAEAATAISIADIYRERETDKEIEGIAKQILRDIQTPMDVLNAELDKISKAYTAGAIDFDQYTRANEKAINDYNTALERQAKAMGGDSGGPVSLGLSGGVMGADYGGMSEAESAFWDYNTPRGGWVGGSIPDNFRYSNTPSQAAESGGRQTWRHGDVFGYQQPAGDPMMEEQNRILAQIAMNTGKAGMVA